MVVRRSHFRVAFLAFAAAVQPGPTDAQVPSAVPLPRSSVPDQGAPVRKPPGQFPSGELAPGAVVPGTFVAGQPVPGQVVPGVVYEEESWFDRINPFRAVDPSKPVTVDELCKRLDHVAEKLRDEGLVVVKQPDVFSQARLTRFRYDFDQQLSSDLGNFHLVLAARINRLDAATTTQTTALSAALAAPGSTAVKVPDLPDVSKITTGGTSLFGPTIDQSKGPFGNLGLASNTLAQAGTANVAMGLGVDPTVYLDEKKRFLEHLNHIRRLNLGPDQNDSSGYGLYLIRLPVSITPGERTHHGFGAEVAVKLEHEFPPDFLPSTFRNLVINDIVDQLGPLVYESIRSGFYDTYLKPVHDAKERRQFLLVQNAKTVDGVLEKLMEHLFEYGELEKEAKMPVRLSPTQAYGDRFPSPTYNPGRPFDVDAIVRKVAKFIFFPATTVNSDVAAQKRLRESLAKRLTAIADARQEISTGMPDEERALPEEIQEYRTLIAALRRGDVVDQRNKPLIEHLRFHAIDFIRVIVLDYLFGADRPPGESLSDSRPRRNTVPQRVNRVSGRSE